MTVFKERRQGFYTFNHFNALYGPANGLYGIIKNKAKECQELDWKWTAKSWKGKNKKRCGEAKEKRGGRSKQEGPYRILEKLEKRKLNSWNKKRKIKIRKLKWTWHFYSITIYRRRNLGKRFSKIHLKKYKKTEQKNIQ